MVFEKVESIRIIPMSLNDISFIGKTISEVQTNYFLTFLPYGKFRYKKSANEKSNSLFLFQFKAQIIAYAILKDNIKKKEEDYSGAYYFEPTSITIFKDPLNVNDIRSIWNEFKKFGQTIQRLDLINLDLFLQFISNRNKLSIVDIMDTSDNEEDHQLPSDVENLVRLDEIKDEPRTPFKFLNTNQKWVWGRNILTKLKALDHAGYSCEINTAHEHFISRASGKSYVEAHHLIPMKQQEKFKNSLDVEANIVSLCVVCHNKIHKAFPNERNSIIERLYTNRVHRLKLCGLPIELSDLLSFYD
nr:HNH endonuclease [Paenibacillus phytohabitans]